MNREDPERYIRDLERGSSFPGSQRSATLTSTRFRRVLWVCLAATVFAIAMSVAHYAGKTTVHGNLEMINNGARDTIDCNDGNLKLDGSNNTYTVTGHCRRLDIFGGANHVAVESADTISVFGDDNTVTWQSGSPRINRTGNNNTVSQAPRR